MIETSKFPHEYDIRSIGHKGAYKIETFRKNNVIFFIFNQTKNKNIVASSSKNT